MKPLTTQKLGAEMSRMLAQSLMSENQRAEFEKEYLIRLLRTTEGNVTLAANMAGRNRTDFYKLLNRHGIEAANFKLKS